MVVVVVVVVVVDGFFVVFESLDKVRPVLGVPAREREGSHPEN